MATQSIFFSQIAFSQQSRLFIKHELMGKQGAMKSETGFTWDKTKQGLTSCSVISGSPLFAEVKGT